MCRTYDNQNTSFEKKNLLKDLEEPVNKSLIQVGLVNLYGKRVRISSYFFYKWIAFPEF